MPNPAEWIENSETAYAWQKRVSDVLAGNPLFAGGILQKLFYLRCIPESVPVPCVVTGKPTGCRGSAQGILAARASTQ